MTEHPHHSSTGLRSQHAHQPRAHDPEPAHDMGTRSMALSATLHCLTGCAIGEILGLVIGTAIGLSTGWTVVLAVSLAFLFGYALSTLPLLRAGVGLGTAPSVVLAADTCPSPPWRWSTTR